MKDTDISELVEQVNIKLSVAIAEARLDTREMLTGKEVDELDEKNQHVAKEIIELVTRTLTNTTLEALSKCREAKKKHKDSNQCGHDRLGGCTACHFWSGSISALSELLGESGVID